MHYSPPFSILKDFGGALAGIGALSVSIYQYSVNKRSYRLNLFKERFSIYKRFQDRELAKSILNQLDLDILRLIDCYYLDKYVFMLNEIKYLFSDQETELFKEFKMGIEKFSKLNDNIKNYRNLKTLKESMKNINLDYDVMKSGLLINSLKEDINRETFHKCSLKYASDLHILVKNIIYVILIVDPDNGEDLKLNDFRKLEHIILYSFDMHDLKKCEKTLIDRVEGLTTKFLSMEKEIKRISYLSEELYPNYIVSSYRNDLIFVENESSFFKRTNAMMEERLSIK